MGYKTNLAARLGIHLTDGPLMRYSVLLTSPLTVDQHLAGVSVREFMVSVALVNHSCTKVARKNLVFEPGRYLETWFHCLYQRNMVERRSLVLIPGMLCNHVLWEHQLHALDDIADMTVADTTLDNGVEEMATRVLREAPDRFSVAGLSMGGYVAQAIMRAAPDRVSRLALIDTSARADNEDQQQQRSALISQVQKAAPDKFVGATRRLLPLLIHPGRLDDSDLVNRVMDMTRSVGRDTYIRQQTANLTRPDGRKELGTITCPTLLICGRQDALTPPKVHVEMHDTIAGSILEIIEDCGHLAPMERPEQVSNLLRKWLEAGD